MKIFLLIYNPAAGDSYFKYRLDSFVEHMQKQQCLLIPFRTGHKNDTLSLLTLTRQYALDGILISGGDGTVHEIINAMLTLGIDLPIGIIPSGTSNDLASFLRLEKDVEACAALFAGGLTRLVDVGAVNDRYFLNVASAGLLTGVAHTADRTMKNTLGKAAYYLKGIEELPRFRAIRMTICADDVIIDSEVMLFLVMNGGTVGSFDRIAPHARIDDGKLDLLIVHRCSLPELARILISLLSGAHINHKAVQYLQASRISIESDELVESDLDGELGPALPLTITALPQRLRVFSPARTVHFKKITGFIK
ncbi:diacylglycerol/lipid kinase family protein [Anaerospora hongkongensis]|uniref:diacylglycerol/lipid kinase family protein n=1 Tax=Anaerospora hongkongensis TaxID=244830 RepID=UPI002FD9123B